nr:hypothetical protein Iba_chr06aCG11030 [Ipomoea batatas]
MTSCKGGAVRCRDGRAACSSCGGRCLPVAVLWLRRLGEKEVAVRLLAAMRSKWLENLKHQHPLQFYQPGHQSVVALHQSLYPATALVAVVGVGVEAASIVLATFNMLDIPEKVFFITFMGALCFPIKSVGILVRVGSNSSRFLNSKDNFPLSICP